MAADPGPRVVVIRFTDAGGVGIAWDSSGSGPPLLLLGSGFVSIEAMEEEARFSRCLHRLSQFATLLRFDRRGVGLSDPPRPDRPLSVDDWVIDAIAVLDAAGVRESWLMGAVEMAGLAVSVAARHPDRVTGLILVNGSARALEAADYPIGHSAEMIAAFLDDTLADAPEGELGTLQIYAPSAAEDPAFRRWFQRTGRRGASPAVAREFLRLVLYEDVRPDLAQVRAPTLVLHRKGDLVVPVEQGRYVAAHINGARFVELEGEDNLWWVGDADAVLNEIELFVTGRTPEMRDDRINQAVLFTDIVGSTERLSRLGDRQWSLVLDAHEVLIRRALERYGGSEVQFTGDGVLAVFDDAEQAVACAHAARSGAADLGLQLRAGVHHGPVARRGPNVAGLTVHIAARVAALARADEVLCTRAVCDVLDATWQARPAGQHVLKGVDGPWEVFDVAPAANCD